MSTALPHAYARWLRRGLGAAAAAGVLSLVIALRVVTASRAELATADALRARHDLDAAIVHYRRAARWYAPLSPYHRQALQALARIADAAEAAADTELALRALRAIRGAILATRSFYVPESERLRAANRRIAKLMAAQPPPGMDAGKSRASLEAEHLALLSRIAGPNVFWTCALLAGFVLWIGAAFAFSQRAIDAQDRFVPREVRRCGALMALGFGLFVVGMWLV